MVGTPPDPSDPGRARPDDPTDPLTTAWLLDGPDRGRFAGTPGLLGPLDLAPACLAPPYTTAPARWQVLDETDRATALTEALHGVRLGAHDRQVLGWLARWDVPTVATVTSLVRRARHTAIAAAHAGPGSGGGR